MQELREEPYALYDLLGVDKSADKKEINRAYKKLAMKHHPDKPGGDKEFFQQISHAAEILTDDEQREAYDRNGGMERGAGRGMPSYASTDFTHAEEFFRQFFGGRDPFEDFFSEPMFQDHDRRSRRSRRSGQSRQRQRQGQDPFDDFFGGGSLFPGGGFGLGGGFPSAGGSSFMSSSSSSMSSGGGTSKQVFSRTVNGHTVTETKIKHADGTTERFVDNGDGQGTVRVEDDQSKSDRAKLTS